MKIHPTLGGELNKPFILRTPEGNIYKPNPAQLAFHTNPAKFRWYGGGKGGGKTIAAAAEAILTMIRYPGSKGVIVLKDYRHLEETAWEHFRDMLKATCQGDLSRLVAKEHGTTNNPMILFHNGSVVHGWNNQDEANKGGLKLSWFWIDEAHLSDNPAGFIELGNRMRHGVGPRRGWNTGYVNGFDWQHDLFIKKGFHTHQFLRADTDDNLANLPDDYLDTFLGYSEEQKLQFMRGEFIQAHGGVLHFWDDPWHIADPFPLPPSWPRYRAIDPGRTPGHQFACVWFAVDEMGNIYVTNVYLRWGITITEAGKEVQRISGNEPIEYTVCDPAAWGTEPGEKNIMEMLLDAGITNLIPGNNDIANSVALIQDHLYVDKDRRFPLYDLAGRSNPDGNILGSPKLFVFSGCTNLITQIRNWRYGKDGKPKKGNDDALAALRYGLMSRFRSATVASQANRNPFWVRVMEDAAKPTEGGDLLPVIGNERARHSSYLEL